MSVSRECPRSRWSRTMGWAVVACETPRGVIRAFGPAYYGPLRHVRAVLRHVGTLGLAETTWTADTYRLPAYLGSDLLYRGLPSGVFLFEIEARVEQYPANAIGDMVLGRHPLFLGPLDERGSCPTPHYFDQDSASEAGR